MIGGTIFQLACVIDLEYPDFRAASLVAVTDDRDGVVRDKHLVVPGGTRIDIRSESVAGGDRLQCVIADSYCKKPAASQDHQMITMQLNDVAFIHSRMLNVCN